jgi:phage gp29-like protein
MKGFFKRIFGREPEHEQVRHRQATGGGLDVDALVKAANVWRDQMNPLRSLTISRAVSLLEASQRGQMADLQWTYKFIEETHPTLLALVERRTSSLLEMDWNIHQVAEDRAGRNWDKNLADEQAAALREAYERIDNLYEAIEHLEMAAFRMFAHVQPHMDGGEIVHLEPLDNWNFGRDGMFGDWYWNPDARDLSAVTLGDERRITPDHRLISRVQPRHVNRIGLLQFIRASMATKDWDGFVEIYGLPRPIIIMPEVPAGKEAEFEAAAEAVAEGGGGALPSGSLVNYPSETRGSSPFKEYLEWLQQQLVLVGTGGLLTMLAESGSGTLAGGAHMETFRAIAASEARKISEILQRTLDRWVLERQFPARPRLAYFAMAAREERDIGSMVTHAQSLAAAGYIMDVADLAERTGYKLTYVPPAPAAPAMPGMWGQHRRGMLAPRARHTEIADEARDVGERRLLALMASTQDQLTEAESARWMPIAARIQEAAQAGDVAQAVELLRQLRAELPTLAQAIMNDERTADILDNAMSAALVNGVATAAVVHGTPVKEGDAS